MSDPRDSALPPEKAAATPAVLVVDAQPQRGAAVARVLRESGLRPHRVRWLAPAPTVGREWPQVVVVGLPDDPANPVSRAWLEAGVRAGLRPICYGDGLSSWPLRHRAQLLLVGATRLLDSAESDFLAAFARVASEQAVAESRRRREQDESRQLMAEMGIVGESEAMQATFRWVQRISQLSDLPVLLTGETGTGKELLARAIHRLDGKRRRGPFVALNCNALSESLAESELFGHRSGAFTGAMRDRKGLFRAADGGVLLLDEIGDLALSLQGKLLRALQEGSVLGLGEDAEAPVDVRVIAATNRDLERQVREGLFREDLYQRISVLVVRVAPLRERPEDLRPLTEHFAHKHAALCGVSPRGASNDFLEAIGLSGLPGNARQLENLVRSALLRQAGDSPMDLASLPAEFWRLVAEQEQKTEALASLLPEPASAPGVPQGWAGPVEGDEATLAASLQRYERMLLMEAMQRSRGNQTRAARLLGVTPRSVYNKLRKHKLIA